MISHNNTPSPTYPTTLPTQKSASRRLATCICISDARMLCPPNNPKWGGSLEWLFNVYRSSCIVGIQVHLLLPPPFTRYRSSLPLRIHAVAEDAAFNHICSDPVSPFLYIRANHAQPTLLQNIIRLGICPLSIRTAARHVLLRHLVRRQNMETLQPRHHRPEYHPRLAAVF